MKRVIAYSLWGINEKYTEGAVENARLAKLLFPDWKCRFYIDENTLLSIPNLHQVLLEMDNTEIIVKHRKSENDWIGLFWRFLPCSDVEVEYMMSRDCDSRLTKREKSAVDEWLKSGKSFHIIRDHPWHTLSIMGGLWGTETSKLRDMKDLISSFAAKEIKYDDDQRFLNEYIYPRIKSDCFIHDEFSNGNKIPQKRKGSEFVGQVFDPKNERTLEHKFALEEELKKKSILFKIKRKIRALLYKVKNLFERWLIMKFILII